MDLEQNQEENEQKKDVFSKIGETLIKMQEPLEKMDNIVQNVLHTGEIIAGALAKIDVPSILGNISRILISVKYIDLLGRLRWPLFLINDENLQNKIMTSCTEIEDPDIVGEIVLNYCDDIFFDSLEKCWTDCPVIKRDRILILSEAIHMHRQGCYYSSVSILMCQIYGVAGDIYEFIEKNSMVPDQDMKELIAYCYGTDLRYIDNERGRLLQSMMLAENGMFLWDSVWDYLKNVIFVSGDKKDYSDIMNQPLRNKIAHGVQLNYGTKEHSVKAFLTIDILIQLAYEINRVAKAQEQSSQL